MIRLEAFLDDNKAGKVLHALDGLVIQLSMSPVHNATKQKGKVVGAGNPTTGREVIAAVIQHALAQNKIELTTKDFLAAAQTYGISKPTVVTAVQHAIRDRLLKRVKRGEYQALKQEAK